MISARNHLRAQPKNHAPSEVVRHRPVMNIETGRRHVEHPAKALHAVEEARRLLESLRMDYQTLRPEVRQGVKSFLAELMKKHDELALGAGRRWEKSTNGSTGGCL